MSSTPPGTNSPRNILVTGAGGQTGRIVLKKLLDRPEFSVKGVVRTEVSKQKLSTDGVSPSNILIADVCDPVDIEQCCQGMDALIICTSAVPAPTGEMTPEGRPVFGYPNGQPDAVDWLGQKIKLMLPKR